MTQKISLNRRQITENIGKIPAANGLMIFSEENGYPLYLIRTNNLHKLYLSLFNGSEMRTDVVEKLAPVLSSFSTIDFLITCDDFTALLEEKRILKISTPSFAEKIRLSDEYSYLAINCRKFPFISLADDTNGDSFYLGPFPDKFLLRNALDILCKYRQTPSCEGNNFPCILQEQCSAYCINNKDQLLRSRMLKSVIMADDDLVTELSNSFEAAEDELEFEAAYNISLELKVLNKYYQILRFLATVKDLTLNLRDNNNALSFRQGLLHSFDKEDFSAVNRYYDNNDKSNDFEALRYRPNEFLAIPKDQYRESLTVFNKILKTSPRFIEDELDRKKTILPKLFTELEC